MNEQGRKGILTIRQLVADGLRIDRFTMAPGEAWCLVGGNGSGIEQFCEVIAGEQIDYRARKLSLPPDIGVLSFKRQQSIFEAELRKDDTDFLDRLDPGTPARAFLTDIDRHRRLIELFAFSDLLDRGYRQLSSGQERKLCLLQQITGGVGQLILENPYEGLDKTSRAELDRVLAGLRDQGLGLLVLVNNSADIPDWCTHLAAFRAGTIAVQGPRTEVLAEVAGCLTSQPPLFQVTVADFRQDRGQADETGDANLVTLRSGFARYGEVEVFTGLDLAIGPGDHTLITGPNGCGKSTLLQLICGDHPLCYANDLALFGRRRGSGESIWELKRRMGILSPDLHRNHRVAGSGLAIVVSGLFDSIGLYTRPSEAQLRLGRRWLERLGLAHKAQQPFRQMNYGEQRLLLLARALIKSPQLLLLDEPTLGLDEPNRMALLDFLAGIAGEQLATIVYVSHRPDEYRDFFRQHVRFA
ncbi:MAG: ATP-binding cassette domain-containing protein [Desulfobulbus sp.]|jgi:molybdate transport system ATP-binding protein|uniref:ATP-binding cassette domain-containing protein n=1 Tax=Desulfobulbus sp. TaxID=895 RepID=UPI002846948D|nr:ATP-binding cassette domain-containing protein [Desulfobulbus sp.]MDR2551199.1 ATP-binding cassette domain-containing protein [Desulfobulbus sp.]